MDEMEDSGLPITRSLMLEFDDTDLEVDDQFMLGPTLMMAPILERGAISRDVVFPKGNWQHYFTDEIYEIANTTTIHIQAPLGQPAVFKLIRD